MIKTVNFSWNDLESVKRAERKKAKLENEGYTLIKETAGFFTGTLIYRKERTK